FDASAKFPGGVNQGALFSLGNFDECYGYVDHNDDVVHYGKYCLGFLGIGDSNEFPVLQMMYEKNGTFGMYTGFCLSSQCTEEDFSKLFYKHSFTKPLCYSKETENKLTAGGFVTISWIAFVAIIVFCSTSYDIVLTHTKKDPKHSSLLNFSALKNGKRIFTASKNPNDILCLYGIRAISILWVVCFHEMGSWSTSPIGNYYEFAQFNYNSLLGIFINQGCLAVDTFLTVGGFTTAYTLMRRKNINIIESYVHRYLRLTPVLVMAIVVRATLLGNMGNGPLWGNEQLKSSSCQTNWWYSLLYVQNYFEPNCEGHTWYLAVDMQCFVVAVVIMIFLKKWTRMILCAMGCLIFMNVVTCFWISYVYALASVQYMKPITMIDYLTRYYFVTHTRYGLYLIGMMCGYFVHDMKSNSKFNYKMPMVIKILYWATTLTILAACIFYPLAFDNHAYLANAFYNSIHKVVWSLAVCSIILICETDNAGPINNLLSSPVLQVISRLCYCVYIFHVDLFSFKKAILKTVVNFSITQLIFDCWGTIMVTLILSFFCSIMFEMPIPVIENYFVGFVKRIFRRFFCPSSNVVEPSENR
ncbi:Nose resistant to fluoxetine protein 6, partial [Gonioctena quinquepunctata]